MKLLLVLLATIVAVNAVVPIKPINVITTTSEPVDVPAVASSEVAGVPTAIKLSAALPQCSSSTTINVTDASGTIGCQDITSSGIQKYIRWNFPADVVKSFRLTITGYQGSYVIVYSGGQPVNTYYPTTTDARFSLPDREATQIAYYTGTSTASGYGVSITFSSGSKTNHLVSGHTFSLEKEQQGGFVYFSLPYYAVGSLFYLQVDVYSYQGLQEPGVFVSVNNVPTLEKYDYTNQTLRVGDREQMILYQTNPKSGAFVVGVFLFGSAARIGVTATWTFGITKLTSGVKVSASTSSVVYYQVTVPVNTTQLRFQISRQVPGGFPIAYIAQGTLPGATNFEYKADTNVQSYISITIKDPNPLTNPMPNPGNYIIGIAATATSGFIIQCDW